MYPINVETSALDPLPAPERESPPGRRGRLARRLRGCVYLTALTVLLIAVIVRFLPRGEGGLATWTLAELTDDLRQYTFVYTSDEGTQIYVGETATRKPRRVPGVPPGANAASWILGGRQLLVTTDDKGVELPKLWVVVPNSGRLIPLSHDKRAAYQYPAVSPSGNLLAYSSNERRSDAFDVYVVDCATLQRRMVVKSTDCCYPAAFSPDEKRLCVKHVHDSHDSDIDVVDLATCNATRVTPHNGKADYASCVWGPDGSGIRLVTNQDSEFKAVGEINLSRADPHCVVGPVEIGDVSSVAASRDGRYTSETLLQGSAYRTRIMDTARHRHVSLPYEDMVYHASFTPDSTHVLLDARGPWGGPSRFLIDLKTLKSVPIGLLRPAHRDAIRSHWVYYRSGDGTEVHALLSVPRGAVADATHPLIVMFHGGPESQWMPNYSLAVQHYLARGYLVLAPNIRGSTGRGRSWSEADDGRKRRVAFEDGAAAARWAIESKWADPHRVVAMGASYGGYMTLCMLAYYPDLFAAGVDKMGMSDMITFLKHLRPWTRADRTSEYGDPIKDADFLRSISPVYAADRVRAPLLIIQGANDPRVPREQSDEMVSAIRKAGGTVQYLLLPGEGHGWTEPGDFVADVDTTTAFLDKYVASKR